MIEPKEQVLTAFRDKAQAFLDQPNLVTGIDFDDAAVTLKRYVLSEMRDEALGSLLARVPKLIRNLDAAGVSGLLNEVDKRLASS